MKKILLLLMLCASSILFAQSGIYESYLILQVNSPTNTYYDLQANTANPDFHQQSVGAFDCNGSLTLSGAQNKIFKCNSDDIINGKLFYRVYPTSGSGGSFIEVPMNFLSNDPGAGPGCQNQTWEQNNANINLLSGLSPGNYYLEVYTTADFTFNGGSGTHFSSNGGSNYRGTFSVIADTTPPNAVCQNYTVSLDANGQATLTPANINNGSSDNCGIASMSLSRTNFSCSDVGAGQLPDVTKVVISQVYGGGGNSGATFRNDFIELFNAGTNPVNLSGWSVQYASSSGTSWSVTPLNGTIQPGQYYLIQQAAGSGGTTNLPTPNATGTIAMAGTSGKVILVNTTTAQSGSCPSGSQIIDLVGYGSANCFEGAGPTTAPSNTASVKRNNSCTDTNNNAADFSSSTVTPRNTSTAATPCFSASPGVPVVLTVTDDNGNTSTCTATVIVEDNLPPTAVCQNATVQLDANGNGTLAASDIDGGSTDNCGIASIEASQTEFGCDDVGTVAVTLTVTDTSGNTSTCTANVTVEDNVAPNAVCNDITVQLDADGEASITAADVDGGSTDSCGVANLSIDQSTFTCADVSTGGDTGPQIWINEIHYDNDGGDVNEFVEVAGTAGLDLTGYTIVRYNGNGGASYGTDALSGSIDDEGSGYGAVHIVYPVNGLQNGAPDGVALVDPTGNVVEFLSYEGTFAASNGPANGLTSTDIGVSENGSEPIGNSLQRTGDGNSGWTGPADDSPGQLNAGQSLSSSSGVEVTLTVTDSSGNTASCVAIVTVEDNVPPTAICQSATIQLDENGNGTLAASDIDGGSTDNCAIASIEASQTEFGCDDVGTVVVTLTVTDTSGNTSTCTANVTVEDNVAPTAVCNDIAVQLDANGNYTLTPADIDAITAGSNDACGIDSISIDNDTFSCSDVAGAPTPSNDLFISEYIEGSSNNKCIEIYNGTGSNVDLSNYSLEFYFNGNPSAGTDLELSGTLISGDVYVVCDDNSAAVFLAQADFAAPGGFFNGNDAVVLRNNGIAIDIFGAIGEDPGSQWVSGGNTTQNQTLIRNSNITDGNTSNTPGFPSLGTEWTGGAQDDASNLGTHTVSGGGSSSPTVTVIVTDVNGNTASCTATITVEDNIDPIAECQSVTVFLDENGQGTLTAAEVDNGSNDACGIASLEIDQTDFDCSHVGQFNSVNLTVTDNNGNVAVCSAEVIVVDSVAPNAVCQNITVELDASGNATITADQIDGGSNDACGSVTISIDNDTFNCADIANNPEPINDLFISEYVEGSSNNKYLEIYNGTDSDIDLSDYRIRLYANGSGTPTTVNTLSGTLSAGGVIVYSNSGANAYTGSTTNLSAINFNGDDAIELFKISTGSPVDIFGTIGEDPGAEWNVAGNETQDRTLVRNANVSSGNTMNSPGFPKLGTEWTEFPQDDVSNLGSHTAGTGNLVTLTVTDQSGNQSSCTASITVVDNIAPTALCPGNINVDNDPGQCGATVEFSIGGEDSCGVSSVVSDAPADDFFPVGTTTVTVTVTDASGNTDTCSFDVTVNDSEVPTAQCPTEITVDNDPGQCGAIVEFDIPFSDNCPGATFTATPASGSFFEVGSTEVIVQVIDANGNGYQCEFDVTVNDTEAPVVNCLSLQVQLDEFGNGSISVDDIDGDSTDNCGIASITLSQTDFDCDDIGGDLDELIISEYVDGSGNDDCIEIYNGTGSDINLFEGNYTLNFYVDGSSTPTYSVPLLGTIADRDVYVVCNPFGPGAGAADQTGAFAIDGNDAIALVHEGNAVDVFGEIGVNPGSGWSNGGVSTAGTTLVRDQDVLQGNINSFVANLASEWNQFAQNDVSDVGSHTIEITDLANNVILTVTDTSGNVSTCEGNVTVIDSVAPEALCQNVTVQLDANGNATVAPSQVDNGSNDACGIAGLALDQTEFDCSHIGQTNTVVLTVTDSNGNTATCTATVTVEDNRPPNVVTQDITVQLDANGNASIVASDVDGGTSDACGVASLSVTPNAFTCADVGGNTVTLTAVDVNGNSASANATVTVEDNVAPTAVCNAITVQLDASGNYTLDTVDVGDIANGSSDACGIASLSVSPNSFGCDDIGSNTVTLTVTDNNGNVSTCSTTVTVNGVVPSVTITQGPLPDFCQGAVVVLTANSDDAISFLWSTGETTQSIEVAGNGTYSVTVTSSTNCTATASYTVSGFDAGALISSYTILANSEVFLHGNNLVQSGAVGATADNGIIKLHQASTIVGRGQAANFSLNQGSTIGTQVNQPANPTIPAFMFNTQSTTASPDVTVNTGQTQVLNGSVYNIVTVRQDATVIFTQSDVYINELRTFENATISFTGCTNVYLNEKFMLARGGTVNEEGYNVVFYVDGEVQIEQGSYVRARIHTNGNEILAKGANATGNGNGNNAAEPTYMVGLFIAERVHGNKNVIWNSDDVCEPCPASGSAVPPVADNGSFRLAGFGVTAWPNPSDTEFSIRLKSEDMATKATIEVFDINNKKVHSDHFAPTETFRFGKELQGGVYIVKVSQNGNTATERVVKY